MKLIPLFLTSLLMLGCTVNSNSDKNYLLQGAWILRQADYPIGYSKTFTESAGTNLRLYDADSVMYQCWLTRTKTGLTIKPQGQCHVTLIDKGHGEHLYLENDNPHPLTVIDDSTIMIQQNGILYTWHSADGIANDWGSEIMEIMAADEQDSGEKQSYMLSPKERRQANVIHALIFSTFGIVILLILIARIAYDYRKDKRRLQLQLQQIQEVQQGRQKVVKQAIESVEEAYFASDEYHSLQRRIGTGQRLRDDEWIDIETHIRKVYPGFTSQLRNLHAMSELEYQVCLLIKLRTSPSDIAAVMARDASTISTVRSRLYKKVFGQKGGAREWDEFIISIGA